MYQPPFWLTRPLFVSSTFMDMQAERDYLRDKVFPEVAEELRRRFLHLEAIDLRWGVDTPSEENQEAKELLVLKVCLAEIERSRPFLVVLLGDRYGWVPPTDRMQVAVDEAGFKTDVTGKSITALEIEYGVLANPEQTVLSRFYLREPLPYDQMGVQAAKYSDKHDPDTRRNVPRLDGLKAEIERRMKPVGRVHPYPARWDPAAKKVVGLEALGEMVKAGLLADIEQELGPLLNQEPPTWQARHQADLDEFVEHRQRGFRGEGRETICREIVAFALSTVGDHQPWGLCLSGESGSGKSAIFARVHRELLARAQRGELLLLAHAAGISPEAGAVDLMLRRWVGDMASFLGQADPLDDKSKPDEIEQAFSMLLHQAGKRRRVVLIMDALNQLEDLPRARGLTWLPRAWPENARLIATAIPGQESQALIARPGAVSRDLVMLAEDDAGQIFQSVCNRYHRTLSPQVLSILLGKGRADGQPAAGNPLWLTTAVEELNLLDADDLARAEREFTGSPDERLHELLLDIAAKLPPEMEDLYAWMLERSEELWGLAWTRNFANLIALGRFGWRESDFEALLPRLTGENWDPTRFAGLRRSFRAHVVMKGTQGQWDFFHVQARAAVLKRNLDDPAEVRALHSAIADHLLALPADDPLHISEVMNHLYEADDKTKASEYYSRLQLSKEELSGASRILAERIILGEKSDQNEALAWTIALSDEMRLLFFNKGRLGRRFSQDLYRLLEHHVRIETKQLLLESALANISTTIESRSSYNSLKKFTANLLDEGSPIKDIKNGVLPDTIDLDNWTLWQRIKADCHLNIGDNLMCFGKDNEAINAYSEARAISKSLFEADPNNANRKAICNANHRLGQILCMREAYAEAFHLNQESLEAIKPLVDQDNIDIECQHILATIYFDMAHVLREQGDMAGALKAGRKSLTIFVKISSEQVNKNFFSRQIMVCKQLIGDVLITQGDSEEGLICVEEQIDIADRLLQEDPSNTTWQRDAVLNYTRLGNLFQSKKDLVAALKAYKHALAIAERIVANDASNAIWQYDLAILHENIGDVLLFQEVKTGALEEFECSLAIRKSVPQADISIRDLKKLLVILQKTGDALMGQEETTEALKCYEEILTKAGDLCRRDASQIDGQVFMVIAQQRIGDVLRDQGDLPRALKAYRESLSGAEQLSQSDPANFQWQKHRSVIQLRIGDALRAEKDWLGALDSYEESMAIRERLAQEDSSESRWLHEFSTRYAEIGDALKAKGRLSEALRAFRHLLAITEHVSNSDSTNLGLLEVVLNMHQKVGAVLHEQGDLPAALAAYRASQGLAERLCQGQPGNNTWHRDLLESWQLIGDVLFDQHDLPGALKAYRDSLVIAERLCQVDQSNDTWQRNLLVSHQRMGNVLTAQCDLPRALKVLKVALDIAERLSKAYPNSFNSQRDLFVTCQKIGAVLKDMGDLPGALKVFSSSIAAAERLCQIDPSNAVWLQGLSLSHTRVGDVLLAQGEMPGAVQAFLCSLSLDERVICADPSNSSWLQSLWVGCYKVANTLEKMEDPQSVQYWQRAHDVLDGMKQRGIPLSAQDNKYLLWLARKIAR